MFPGLRACTLETRQTPIVTRETPFVTRETPLVTRETHFFNYTKCATLRHVLNGCPVSLNQGRYTWRHNSVLTLIVAALRDKITAHTSKPMGLGPCRSLDNADDWVLLHDLHGNLQIPSTVLPTPTTRRPDILLYSLQIHKVIIIELTCPTEDRCSTSRDLKTAKYSGLITELELAGNSVDFFTVEVGSRGYWSATLPRMFKALDIQNRKPTTQFKIVVAKRGLLGKGKIHQLTMPRPPPRRASTRRTKSTKTYPPLTQPLTLSRSPHIAGKGPTKKIALPMEIPAAPVFRLAPSRARRAARLEADEDIDRELILDKESSSWARLLRHDRYSRPELPTHRLSRLLEQLQHRHKELAELLTQEDSTHASSSTRSVSSEIVKEFRF